MTVITAPACSGQTGVIRCECGGWGLDKRMDCVRRRYIALWSRTVANLPNNRARNEMVYGLGLVRGTQYAQDVRDTAKAMMGALL